MTDADPTTPNREALAIAAWIEVQLALHLAPSPHDKRGREIERAALDRIIAVLITDHDAAISMRECSAGAGEYFRIDMAGTVTDSTFGPRQALRNWCARARLAAGVIPATPPLHATEVAGSPK